MATTRVDKSRIQVKHILIALVGIVSTMLFAAAIVLITIGYLNPFGTVGLGILGGGCVAFFSAVLFLCACSIWIKNKYYGDETDCKEKLVGRSSEDITLLKPASNIFSSEPPEAGREKNIEGDDNNPVPLYSVSTVYSSVSSSSAIPEKLMPYNWQEEDIAGALDSDVFSASLTALQHGDMKSQQRLEPTKSPAELLIGGLPGQNGQKVKDDQKRQHANKTAHNNEKYITNLPRQRKPMAMDSPYVPHGKQMEISLTDTQGSKTKETHSSTQDLRDRNTQHFPVYTPKTTAAISQDDNCKGSSNHHKNQVQAERNRINVKPNNQKADRQELTITESDTALQNTTYTNKQDIIRKDATAVLARNLEKKHNSSEETYKCNRDRTAVPLQGLWPQSKLDKPANVQVPSNTTEVDAPRGKVLITRKQNEPGTRTNP